MINNKQFLEKKNVKNSNFKKLNYKRSSLSINIIHLGVGNFHRAHQAFYIHRYLSLQKSKNWGICGIGILDKDKDFFIKFKKQKYLYTLTECSPNNNKNTCIIGSIIEYLFMPDNPEKSVNRLTDPLIKIVSLTITEGGYNIDRQGNFNFSNPDIQHDLKYSNKPKTVFGLVIEALRKRRKQKINPFTLLSCDNLQYNGDVTKKAFLDFARAKNKELADWIEKKVSFPNSMVDRITPVTIKKYCKEIKDKYNIVDNIPIFCEDFIQWILEDNFCYGRPKLEIVGVFFTKKIRPYELAKLRLLNASHSMIAYPALLSDIKYVHEIMKEKIIKNYLNNFMDIEVIPFLESPIGLNLIEYKEKIIYRFSNPELNDQVKRICFDGISKISIFIVPTLLNSLKNNINTSKIPYFLACYRHFLLKINNLNSDLKKYEPNIQKEDIKKIISINPIEFLNIKIFKNIKFLKYKNFVKKYIEYEKKLYKYNSIDILKNIV